VCGVVASSLVQRYFLHGRSTSVERKVLLSGTVPRFIPVSSLLEPDYHIYFYRTPASDDPEEITLYGDFRSAQVTGEHFESNATSDAAKLIERGSKFDEKGQKIGKRGVTVFTINQDIHAVRIFWTEGGHFLVCAGPFISVSA